MSLMESISGILSPRMLEIIATKFGIPSPAVGDSVKGITGTLVDGLAGDASNMQTMRSVASLVNESPDEVEDLDRMVDDDHSPMRLRGNKLLGFASRDVGGLTSRIASMLGLSSGSATGLLGTVASLVMGGFRRYGKHNLVDAKSLASLLRNERSSFSKLIPAGLRAPEQVAELHRPGVRELAPPHKRSRWPLWIIPLALIAIFLFARGRHHKAEMRKPTSVERYPAGPAARETPTPHRTMPSVQANTPEGKLASELTAKPGTTAQWVNLDEVKFDTGSAQLDESSNAQIARVAQVLAAYPDAKVELAGAAQGTGTPQANAVLSRDRAESVKRALVTKGIDESRIDVTTLGTEAAQQQGVSIKVAR